MDFLFRQAQEIRHVGSAVFAHCDERIDIGGMRSYEPERLITMRLSEPLKEELFSLEGAAYGSVHLSFEFRRQTHQQGIREIDDVRR